ncbi:hypothetical protein M378DRAFT_122268 [Amanita muscaria Koide BX008]|uniref:Adenosine deaminase n=1 Tax=Amanita muscaria (strain Koide BX008) TaxID=946122 RepID=A0A0C2X1F8_AMAMK|nr:hypothetical protein M378DRAFT_122268 [Amanita muscaria Koide BX008]
MSSSEIETYRAKREAFINDDRSLRRENIWNQQRTEAEIKADSTLRKLRDYEASTIWKEESESILHPFPGMEFLTGRSIIVRTRIYQILSKMPKGALLHAHLDATVDQDKLLKLALKHPAMHVRVPEVVTAKNITSILPTFKPLPLSEYADGPGVTDQTYNPDTFVSIQKARSTFDPNLGGPEGFDKWVCSTMMINPAEAYGTHNTITKIWKKFASTFMVSTGLIRFVPVFTEYIREFFMSSIEDGISYVEPRINFMERYMVGEDGHQHVPHREWLIIFERVLDEVKAEMKRQGREDDFIGAKIIYSTLRFYTAKELVWYTEDCIALKKEFPHLIAGFDLVGDENVYKPLIDYLEPLQSFRRRQQEESVDIPFIFHAGETMGDGTTADMNLYDAILLGTKRIGHGFSIVKHPKLMELCREKGIALEVCPISNEILRLTSSMPMHPLPIMLNNGIPVALSSDDPGTFGHMGLTFDYYQVLVSSEITGLSTLGAIARDSIEFSMMTDNEKQRAMTNWEKRWKEFIEGILSLELAN